MTLGLTTKVKTKVIIIKAMFSFTMNPWFLRHLRQMVVFSIIMMNPRYLRLQRLMEAEEYKSCQMKIKNLFYILTNRLKDHSYMQMNPSQKAHSCKVMNRLSRAIFSRMIP